MAGHNKWTQIKHKKNITDKKRGLLFSKLLRAISVAARTEANPQFNPVLRSAIDKAKKFNVPLENIERAMSKSQEAEALLELVIEAYGPDGVALIIRALTDNRNRTVAEIKKILVDHYGKWAEPGSVAWAFTKKGIDWVPNFTQPISPRAHEQLAELIEALDDHSDVDEIYTNAAE